MNKSFTPFRWLYLAIMAVALIAAGGSHAANVPAPAPAVAPADFEKLQDQVRSLDKDNAVLNAKIEAQNNRIADLSLAATQQGNHIALVSNQTTVMGNYLGLLGVFIPVLLIVAGLITYQKARTDARAAAEAWVTEHSEKLTREISDLQSKVTAASQEIKTHTDRVMQAADDAKADIHARRTAVDAMAATLLKPQAASSDGAKAQQAAQQVTQLSEDLKAKPEKEFTSADHFTRGLALLSAKNYASALDSFDAAASDLALDAATAAKYLFAKGVTLSLLERQQDAVAVYEAIEGRYGADSSPGVREQVAKAMFNKGIETGKLHGPEKAIAVFEAMEGRFGPDSSPGVREVVANAMGNKGVETGKLHGPEKAIAVFEAIEKHYGADSSPSVREVVANAMGHKGVQTGKLHGPEKEIAVYEAIEARYGADSSPGVREQVENAKNGAAFGTMILAKQDWTDEALRTQRLRKALSLLEAAVAWSSINAVYLGNLGYCHFLLGEEAPARKWTAACLQAGGQAQLELQRGDAKLHRLEPQDTAYEALLDELWGGLQARGD